MTQIKTTLSSDQIRSLINEFLQERLNPPYSPYEQISR